MRSFIIVCSAKYEQNRRLEILQSWTLKQFAKFILPPKKTYFMVVRVQLETLELDISKVFKVSNKS